MDKETQKKVKKMAIVAVVLAIVGAGCWVDYEYVHALYWLTGISFP